MRSFLSALEYFYLSWMTWVVAVLLLFNPVATPDTEVDYWRACKLLKVKTVSQGQSPSDILFVIQWKDNGHKDVRSVSNETYAKWDVGDNFSFEETKPTPYANSSERKWSVAFSIFGGLLLISKMIVHGNED